MKKNNILVCLIIGFSFFWTGSGYISWLYNLIDIMEVNSIDISVDLLTEVLAYIMQALGMVIMSVAIRRTNLEGRARSNLFIVINVLTMVLMFPSILSHSFAKVLVTGYIMNILIGCIFALYLFMLSELVPANRRGIIFGLGYSIGSIGSWIISLISDDNFLKSVSVLVIYLLLMTIVIVLILITDNSLAVISEAADEARYNKGLIQITGIMIFLLCTAKGIGFYFPMADISSGSVSLELSRAFYAIGLIIAGLLNDYKRTYGGIACVAALMFPFVLLTMTTRPEYSFYTWILSYVFIGFYNVFRVLIFADLADRTPYGLYLAPLGLMWGRLGDAVGAAIGISFAKNVMTLVILSTVMFAVTIVMAFYSFQKIYLASMPKSEGEVYLTHEDKIAKYAVYHDLSTREKEVLPLILEGHSNSEISEALVVSENTIKFHVRNILKKTGCSNRQELTKSFHNYS